jgi:hypothetical protein
LSEATWKVVPSLLSSHLDVTERFYTGLGFVRSGGSVHIGWLELRRNDFILQFYANPPVGTPSAPIMSGTIYCHLEGIDQLASDWSGTVAFEWGPETMDYGMREFGIRDPDGYFIAFATPT